MFILTEHIGDLGPHTGRDLNQHVLVNNLQLSSVEVTIAIFQMTSVHAFVLPIVGLPM